MTDKELISILKDNCYDSGILIQDDNGINYEITSVESCLCGAIHNIVKIKKVNEE